MDKFYILIGAVILILSSALADGIARGSSSKFTVDTRGGDAAEKFRIVDVSSDYCNGEYGLCEGRTATFMSGPSLSVDFSVEIVNGGKDQNKTVSYCLVNGSRVSDISNFRFDVGSLAVGGKLEVVAVASDGSETKPFRVNLDMADGTMFSVSKRQPDRVIYETFSASSIVLSDAFNGAFDFMKAKIPFWLVPGIEWQWSFDSATAERTLTFGGGVQASHKWQPFGVYSGEGQWSIGKLGQGVDIKAMIEGGPTDVWAPNRRQWVSQSCALGINVGCEVTPIQYRIPQTLSAVYVSAGFTIDAKIAGEWTQDEGLNFTFLDDDFAKLGGCVGAGENHLLAVEGYVNGGIALGLQGPRTPHLDRLGLTYAVGWRFITMGMTQPFGELSGTQWLVGNRLSLKALSSGVPRAQNLDYSKFQPLARDYLARPRLMATKAAGVAAGGNVNERVVVANGYQMPEPAIASAEGKDALLYVVDDSSRSALDRSKLVCALGSDGDFGMAESVWDDGTPDFKPSVGLAEDGAVFAAWMNGKRVYPEGSTLTDLFAGSEIAVAVRNPNTKTWTHRNLTDDNELDHSPVVAVAENGTACVVWLHDASNDPLAAENVSTEIWGAKYSDGVWSAPTVVAAGIGRVSAVSATYADGVATIVCAEASDADASVIRLWQWDESGVSAAVAVDGVSLNGTEPSVLRDADGNVRIVYWDGENINVRGLDGSIRASKPTFCLDGGFALARSNGGRMAVVGFAPNAAFPQVRNPFVSYYDEAANRWSGAIPLVGDARQQRSLSAALADDGGLRLAYASVAVTKRDDGAVEYGGVDLRVLARKHGIDLAIGAGDIGFDESSEFEVGKIAKIRAKVHNIGDVDAANVPVRVSVGESEDDLMEIADDIEIASIAAGGVVEIEANWWVFIGNSNLLVRVEVDPNEVIDDIDRSNNAAMRSAVTAVGISDTRVTIDRDENKRLLGATVFNSGGKSAPEGTIVTFKRADGSVIGTDVIGAVLPGEGGEYEASVVWNLNGLSFSEPYETITVSIDPPTGVKHLSNERWQVQFDVMTSLDSDGDKLLDGEETLLGTDVQNPDTDGDGCSDYLEVYERHTNPRVVDGYQLLIGENGELTGFDGNLPSNLVIPVGVKSIGHSAFRDCDGLASVTIPTTVTNIGSSAFYGCTGLTAVTIPSAVTSIGLCAFACCDGLVSVTIPSSVTRIGESAFYDCRGLESVTILAGVESIGYYAFRNCVRLTSVSIPSSVKRIGYGAFLGCNKLVSVSINDLKSWCNIKFGSGSSWDYAANPLHCAKHLYVGGQEVVDLEIPSNVKSISNYAFYGYSGFIKLVSLPASVTSIGNASFYGCGGIMSFDVDPSNVAYRSINGLLCSKDGRTLIAGVNGDVVIPFGVTSIARGTFYNCNSLTSVVIPSSVTNIARLAFEECSALRSVTIPACVTSLSSVFPSAYSKIERIMICDDVTSIGDSAFFGCRGLTSITIPSSVTSIGDSAFSGCSGLTSITIPSSVTSIGDSAFSGCRGFKSLSIPASVTSIGDEAFYGCGGLVSFDVDPSNIAYRSINGLLCSKDGRTLIAGVNGDGVIPFGVTNISNGAFHNCEGLMSVVIPSSVKSIGYSAFDGCSGLTSVTIPEGVASIGSSSFARCSGLMSVAFPSSVTSIGMYAFRDCERLASVHISDLTAWCAIDFDGWSASPFNCAQCLYVNGEEVVDLIIPSNVTSVADYAFNACDGLRSVVIPPNVTNIGDCAFSRCEELESVVVSEGVASIGCGAFERCYKLAAVNVASGNVMFSSKDGVLYDKAMCELILCPAGKCGSVTIPSSVKDILDNAFDSCKGLTSVTIPPSVTSIGELAFSGCYGLNSLSIPPNVESVGYGAFWECVGLTSLTISEGVKSIGEEAFECCEALTSVEIPSSVVSVGGASFYCCSGLKSVKISEGVVCIGWSAFWDCVGLEAVTIPSSVMSIESGAFDGCSALKVIHVSNNGDIEAVKQMLVESGFDVNGVTFDHFDEPIPELGSEADSTTVRTVLAGTVDTRLVENVTSAERYGAYREWAMKIGAAEVKASPFAWASFATDSAALLAKMPTDDDLKVEEFKPSATAGSFDFTVSVKDVTIGDKASDDNLKKLFGLEGAESLDSAAFSSEKVALDFKEPQDGKLKFTAIPAVDNAKSFFMKVKIK